MANREPIFYEHLVNELEWLRHVSNRLQEDIARLEDLREDYQEMISEQQFQLSHKDSAVRELLDEWNDLMDEIETAIGEYLESEGNG